MDTNEEAVVDADNNEGDVESNEADTIKVPKADYEKLNQTLGSLKRELKDLKKPKEEPIKETPKNEPDNNLLQKAFLRTAQITDPAEVELALDTAKKWGVSIDQLVDDEDFQIKLGKLRTQKSNEVATSGISKGGTGSSQAKNTPEYWIAKGVPPTPTDVPDRVTRGKIAQAMIANAKGSNKMFYNE